MRLSLSPFFFLGSSKPQMMQEEVNLDLAVSGRGPQTCMFVGAGPVATGQQAGGEGRPPCWESPRDQCHWWGLRQEAVCL